MSEFTFEKLKTADKKTADVTIYQNGMVRFSRQAIETYGISDTDILWGENQDKTVLAMQKVSQGRTLRGKRKDTTSCQMQIAKRYAGKYFLKKIGELLVLEQDPKEAEINLWEDIILTSRCPPKAGGNQK